ncbi:hypothetical protein RAS1_25240 [Phycisphaerae bacterium RAS1]|nr:hypothetical protein RAS1_25240 [Phycisphaerae bacterium RAS1]
MPRIDTSQPTGGRNPRSLLRVCRTAAGCGATVTRRAHGATWASTCAAVWLGAIARAAQTAPAQKPAVLRAAEEARSASALVTSRVEYSRWRRPIGADEPDHTHFYTFECAGNQYVTRYWGDEEGVVRRHPDGRAATVYSFPGPRHMLHDDDGDWVHSEGAPSVEVWDHDTHRPDFGQFELRSVSLNPGGKDMTVDQARRKAGLSPIEYSVATDGELDLVSSTHEGWTLKWWIDRKRNFSIVKSHVLHEGKLLGEMLYHTEEIDGAWFTTRLERYVYDHDVRELREIVQVHHAEFNRPEHPQQLTPEHIGVEVGTSVDFQTNPERSGYWDGDKIIPQDEFFTKLHNGELVRSPGVQKALDSLPRISTPAMFDAAEREAKARDAADQAEPELPKPAADLRRQADSAWARYTRSFIVDYGLDREQTQKAWGVLRDCQEQAARYLKREREAFAKLDAAKPPAGDGAPSSSPAADARAARLREPIDRIFESELKPRLERLPTRAQRQRAEKR